MLYLWTPLLETLQTLRNQCLQLLFWEPWTLTLLLLTSTALFQHGFKFSRLTIRKSRVDHQQQSKTGHFHPPNNESKHLVEDHGFKRLRSLEADKIIAISCHRERPKKAVQLLIKTLSLPPVECRRHPMFSGIAFKDGLTWFRMFGWYWWLQHVQWSMKCFLMRS